jgi:type IV secretory pathway VirB2 component (pilin)
VTLIAVIYVIYAGFQIMTGGGDEEKMKKSRNTIFYVFIGIVIMWLAYALVTLVMTALKKTAYD